MNGEVEQVSEQEIADSKAIIGLDGIGCEPAGAVTIAGIRKMTAQGSIDSHEDVIAIVTGHSLKDPDYTVSYHEGTLAAASGGLLTSQPRFANHIVKVEASVDAILAIVKAG
jgi:threonine synthase